MAINMLYAATVHLPASQAPVSSKLLALLFHLVGTSVGKVLVVHLLPAGGLVTYKSTMAVNNIQRSCP